MKLSDRERRCIAPWRDIHHGYCLNFKGVARRCDVEPHNIRRVVRALARKGLLEFQRGLFDESDGSTAGAGYGLTDAGEAYLAALPPDPLQDEPPAASIEELCALLEARRAPRESGGEA